MFDRLIVTDTSSANFKNRSRYFLVSGAIVGVLFASAVIASIYAADYALDNAGFELTTMLPPVTPPQNRPEEPQPAASRSSNAARSDVAVTRKYNIERVEESYTAPNGVSVTQSNDLSRPKGRWELANADSGLGSGKPDGLGTGNGREGNGNGIGSGLLTEADGNGSDSKTTKVPEPPKFEKKEEKLPPAVKSLGVINGKAAHLPKPPYPPAAAAINLSGSVSVNVMINESGKVVSAKAVSGPALFRGAAERAALNAKFDPTTLSNIPVKVTGVIVYKFTR